MRVARSIMYALFIFFPLFIFMSYAVMAQEESTHTSAHKMFQSMTNRLGDCFADEVVISAQGRNTAQSAGHKATGQTPNFEAECDSNVRVISRVNIGGQEVVQDGQTFSRDFMRPARQINEHVAGIRHRLGRDLTIYDTGLQEDDPFSLAVPVISSGRYSLTIGLHASECGGWRYGVNGQFYEGAPLESNSFVTIEFNASPPIAWVGYTPADECFMRYFSLELFKL